MLHLPKATRFFIFLIFFTGLPTLYYGQAGFSISTTLCASDAVMVTASTGTFAATNYQWSSSPAGPVFSAANTSVTTISFPAAGAFTIILNVSSGSSVSTASQLITIHPLPTLTLSSSASSLCAGQDATLTAAGATAYTWTPLTGLYFFSNSSAYISPVSTSSYSISGTNSLGCIGIASYTVNVDNAPNLVLTSSSPSVCIGFASTITANGATNYTWTSSTFTAGINQSSVAVGPGTYSLLGANGGCKDSSYIVITAAPPITVTASSSRDAICRNDGDSLVPVYLSAEGAIHYSWMPYNPAQMSFSIGATTVVTPSASTCYTLTGTTDVCRATAIICVNVFTCTAINEIKNETSVNIFPNPVSDKLFFQLNSQGIYTIKVMNATGKLLLEKTFDVNGPTTQELSMETFSSGIYFIYIKSTGESLRPMRVLKQ